MTARPIVVVKIPMNWSVGRDGRRINWSDCNEFTKINEELKPDYHWFFILNESITEMEFQVFYEKDFTPIQHEELKKLITDSIKPNTSV